jgi:branched-chain amino acid transport system ATP-binding protein
MTLVVQDLAVSFGGVAALAGASFTVEPGSITSLIGPNGAGKTTAFNAITGFVAPAGGDVRYGDRSLVGLRPCDIAARGIVRTFQKTSLFSRLPARDNVLIGSHRRGRAGVWSTLLARRRVAEEEGRLAREAEELLELTGLAHRRDVPADALPYGEQRLLELAIALAARPGLLLLDEPASGMTASEKEAVTRLIQRIRAQGVTILLVEHDMRLVMGISDHVVALNYGRVIAAGPPATVRRHPEVIRAYLGAAGTGTSQAGAVTAASEPSPPDGPPGRRIPPASWRNGAHDHPAAGGTA